MIKNVIKTILIVSICSFQHAHAFELATHGLLTFNAYSGSVLANEEFIGSLGLKNETEPFGKEYLDVSGAEVKQRTAPAILFSAKTIEKDLGKKGKAFTIAGWLMRGAIREDDHKNLKTVVCTINAPNKAAGIDDDDPYPGEPNRPVYHFYDPFNNTGLFGNKKNPDWALGTPDAFVEPLAKDSSRRNHFTVFDAIEYMYRALTGRKSLDGSTAIAPSGYTGTNEELRKAYWATTFRSLGDVVHLVEDMAQPQHTRLDPHSGACWDLINNLVGDTSFICSELSGYELPA